MILLQSDYCVVPLSQGYEAYVSPEDYERVMQYKWYVHRGQSRKSLYARGRVDVEGKRKLILLHCFIGGVSNLDHEDGNGLNCTRNNLRVPPSHSHNIANQSARNPTGFKGVRKVGKKYSASITNGKNSAKHIGCYLTAEEAARAYDKEASVRWGSFAQLNFPKSTE